MLRLLRYMLLAMAILVLVGGCSSPTAPGNVFQLTIAKQGAGQGTVTSSPEGIACGNQCARDVPENTVVTLTAIPDKDSTFEGWGGACSGTASCAATMDAAKRVTVSFGANPLTFALPARLPDATKDVPYRYSFLATRPQGGSAPYKFVLATGVGFPPFGLTISTDKELAGTPTTVETRTFGVCVVDSLGHQECKNTELEVLDDSSGPKSGSWVGTFEMTSDVSFFCSNMPTLRHGGPLESDLNFEDGRITGSATLRGVKSVTIDGSGGCAPAPAPVFTGKVAGTYTDDDFQLTINFGDPDLFVNEVTLSGKLKEGELSGDFSTEGASGTAELFLV